MSTPPPPPSDMPPPSMPPPYGAPVPPPYGTPVQSRQYPVSRYNQRMANRVARRAHLDEQAIAVAYTFNNLATMLIFSLVEDLAKLIPTIGDVVELVISLGSFYFHRIVIVTDQHVYIYRDLPFHRPGKRLAEYPRGPGLIRIGTDKTGWFSRVIRRGQLTFSDGTIVYHGIFWIRRAQYIVQEGNLPPGQ